MKKILLVNLGRRGAGPVYSIEMAKALRDLGQCELRALISKQCENYEAWLKLGIEIIAIDTFETNKEFVISTLKFWNFLKLRKIIKNFSPEYIYIPMIHWWNPIVNFLGRPAKVIFTVHDITQHKGEESVLADSLRNLILKQSERVIILSEVLREKLVAQGVKGEIVSVIPHANFSYYSENFDLEKKTYDNERILFFGRINPYKGLDVLLKAMKIVVKKIPNIKLSVVGNGDISDYKSLIDELKDNLELNVRWIKDEEVEGFFAQSDFVVVPYVEASQSGVIPLSYSLGLPVIASRIGGIPEQVVEGETGFLVEPNRIEELAEKIIELYQDKGLIENFGKNSYIFAKEKLSWEGSAKLLTQVVESL